MKTFYPQTRDSFYKTSKSCNNTKHLTQELPFLIYTLYLGAYATTGLNAVWVAMGLFTLGQKWLTRN